MLVDPFRGKRVHRTLVLETNTANRAIGPDGKGRKPEAWGLRLEVVRKGVLHHALPPGNSCRSIRSLSESGAESIPATEITEITEAQVLSHLKATQVK